ncbi:MAG: aminotransferase class III-fold pyridoxal phosphate-dependent enzyme, partial [Cetobacterium sp.]
MNKITSEGDINTSQNRKKWQEKNIDFETNNVLRDDEEIFLHQSLSTPCLNVLKKSKGIYLEDISGKIYMDFHGNNVHQVGFGNEDVKKAIIDEMETLPFSPRRYTNNSAITLAQKLADKTNGVLNKVLFSPGATSSIGMAMKLARLVTKKDGFLSFWDSFHGASIDAISLGGTAHFRNG